jgi:hypothetical protein
MIVETDIEDVLCRAFVVSLGAGMPSYGAVTNMISWIRMQAKEDEEALTEEYIYSCIPLYINFLFNKA